MLERRFPTILDIGGLLADVPHDGYHDALGAAFADREAMLTLGGAPAGDAAAGFIQRARAHWRDAGFGVWFLRAMDDGGFAGWAGLRRREVAGERTVELAYALAPSMRCKGHAARIGETALALAFEKLALPEVVAVAAESDVHGLPVLERLGFVHDRAVEEGGVRGRLFRRTAGMHRAG